MNIHVDCSCGTKFEIDKQYVGQAVLCPTCGTEMIVPVPVWAPLEPESLPALRVQPVFSSYTLPPPPRPSIWPQYKPWVLGGLAIVVLASLVVLIVTGLIWLSSLLESSMPGPGSAEPAAESEQRPDAGPEAIPAASKSNDDDDDFGDE